MNSNKYLETVARPFWNKACEIYPKLKSFVMPSIHLDGRIKKNLAYNWQEREQIRISKRFYQVNKELYKSDIIGHEIAHQIVFNLFGPVSDDHGGEWIEVMLALDLNPLTHYEVNYD